MSPNRQKQKRIKWLNKRGWVTGRNLRQFGLKRPKCNHLWSRAVNADVYYRKDKIKNLPNEAMYWILF